MPRIASATGRGLTVLRPRRILPLVPFFYPLSNTSTDPTNAFWRSNFAPAGYTFVPNEGIYTNQPIVNVGQLFAPAVGEQSSFNDPDISLWDVSTITTMFYMFAGCTSFNQNISSWDTSNVISMVGMFVGAVNFNQPIGIWDVSNVSNSTGFGSGFDEMFFNASAFNQDLSNWCVSNITATPMFFDNGTTSWTLPRPVWGTCPGG